MRAQPPACFAALAAFAMLFAAQSGAAVAETTFNFAATPGKLPKNVVPTHYTIELLPELEDLSLSGRETVDIEVREATDRVVVNAVNMTLSIADADGNAQATVALDAAAETATLTFAQPLAAGPHTLHLTFKAQINRFSRGLYTVDYPTEHGKKRMIASQLEPADARRIFPCWDEPAFKASFELSVIVPKDFLAISNMPVVSEQDVNAQTKRVAFAPTPKMSSYLFVLAAGELERLSGEADGVSIGVVTTKGKREQGRFALDSAIKLLGYYNDYFGEKYPLPKLDLIALPGGFGGAMENWGGITFFESRLLFDPATSAPDARRGIFIILAHEMAHQWFGDLVTMAWWDNLWLNEGFASWMQAKAADHFFPQWQVWLNADAEKQRAMSVDARRTTHPIQQPVANESEAMAVFDGITYSKGQAFIRMLESYLGEDAFRDGIRTLHVGARLQQYDHGRSVGGARGGIRQAGRRHRRRLYRAGQACRWSSARRPATAASNACALTQERFTIHDPDAAPARWQVPVTYGPAAAPAKTPNVVLGEHPWSLPPGVATSRKSSISATSAITASTTIRRRARH